GGQAGAAAGRSSAADQGPGALLQRHARRPVPARPDGERSRQRARAVGDALAGRRRPFVPRAEVIGQNRRRRSRRSRRREPALACPPMKRLVLCCDGTWNSADQERNGVPAPTNVVKLAYRVAKRDGATLQVIYYDQGVGTGNFFDRLTGGEPIPVRMIGAWDTVGALDIPLRGFRGLTHARYQFHDTELSDIVQYACHALAIDEHRAPFAPTLWTHQAKTGQQVEQVWFCGAHGDIGGGHAESGLSDITLDWMLGKARSAGLAFDSQALAAYPLHGNP